MTHHRTEHEAATRGARGITADDAGFVGKGRLDLSSPTITDGAAVPQRHSAYGDGISPALHWTEGPAGTASYVVLLEDPDAHGVRPWVHWVLYDLPADGTSVGEGLAADLTLDEPRGAMQGIGTGGSVGYFGPRPPARDAAHRYCFEVFALDTPLNLAAGASRDEVREAMRGHVLASGVLVGLYAAAS